MKVRLAKVLAAIAAIGVVPVTGSAHPGHSSADLAAQLSAPLAGPDHVTVFTVVGVLAAIAAARVALYVVERNSTQRRVRRKR